MTNREFYTAIVNSDLNDEMKAFATDAIAKLDARNAKRASTPSKTQKENAPLIEKIASLLTSEPKLASELAKEMEISKYLGQEETREFLGNESYEDTPNAAFGGHIMRNVKSWNEVGLEWDHPFEDSLNTLREIKSYLKKNPCGCGIYG